MRLCGLLRNARTAGPPGIRLSAGVRKCGVQRGGAYAMPPSSLRLTDSCITQLKAQGPSRTGNESKEEEKGVC